MSPLLLRQALQGAAFATLLYGAETWYSEGTPKALVLRIQQRMNDAARAALPVYRTTPIAVLLRETGWGPAKAWLERIHDRLALRTAAADPRHPLRRRWNSSRMCGIRQRISPELSEDNIPPPWEAGRDECLEKIGAVGRTAGVYSFTQWYARQSMMDLFVFSDGALIENQAGAGYSIRRGMNHEIARGTIPLGASAEVYDAEISGATEGLEAALHNPMAFYATNLTICLDNQEAALRLLLLTPTATSSRRIAKFRQLAASWINRTRASCTKAGAVSVRWCPGHSGIPGNEAADALAKSACLMTALPLSPSIARAKREISLLYNASTTAYWDREGPTRYKELGIGPSLGISPELKGLSRRALGALIAARSGHGDFAQYHRRFTHEDALMTCSCGEEKSTDHFFHCSIGRSRARLSGGPRHSSPGIKWVLSTPKGAHAFGKWVELTKFYDEVQRAH